MIPLSTLYDIGFPSLIDNAFSILAVVLALLYLPSWYISKQKKKLPPGPVGLPIIGYLPFLGKEPHRTLDKIGKKYGSVSSLYLGRTLVVVLTDYEAMKEAFNKSETLNRPQHLFELIPDGVGFAGSNGQQWAEQRRYCVRAMKDLGLGKGPWEALISEEVEDFVNDVSEFKGEPVDAFELLSTSISNNIAALVLGRKIEKGSPMRSFLNHYIISANAFFTQSGLHNFFPRLSKVMVKLGIGGVDKYYAKFAAFNEFVKGEINAHAQALRDEGAEDFIDGYLEEMKRQKKENPNTTFNDENLNGSIKSLFFAGSDTTRTSVNWLLVAMANREDVQEKVYDELRNTVGERRIASWEDRLNLPYTFATIMECQRWRTVAPCNLLREVSEDIEILGYTIPKDSVILANLWSVHNDDKYWTRPETFSPERFLKPDGGVNFKPESYVPFSYGKRSCPGETVALMEILLYFSAIVLNFEVKGKDNGKEVTSDGVFGLTYQANERRFRFVPRH